MQSHSTLIKNKKKPHYSTETFNLNGKFEVSVNMWFQLL
ncbi:posterior-2 homeodomain protein, partial [Listeria innocua FSL S4-378]